MFNDHKPFDFPRLTEAQVCRYLNGICASSALWRHMFLRLLGNQIPKPFLLPKPLDDSSAADLETAIRTWDLGWTPTTVLQHYTRQVDWADLGGQKLPLTSVVMTPGGRWVIAASAEGSVWWFDLSNEWTSTSHIEPHVLIKSNSPASDDIEGTIQIEVAADFSSEESLGAFDSAGHSHHLSQFNIAIMTRSANRSSAPTTHVSIWRVHASREAGLSLGECLSSYEEVGSVKLTDVSLHGSAIAYGMDAGGIRGIICVIIVEWEEANGKTEADEIVRRYIPFYPAKVRVSHFASCIEVMLKGLVEGDASPWRPYLSRASVQLSRPLQLARGLRTFHIAPFGAGAC